MVLHKICPVIKIRAEHLELPSIARQYPTKNVNIFLVFKSAFGFAYASSLSSHLSVLPAGLVMAPLAVEIWNTWSFKILLFSI